MTFYFSSSPLYVFLPTAELTGYFGHVLSNTSFPPAEIRLSIDLNVRPGRSDDVQEFKMQWLFSLLLKLFPVHL